MRRSRTFFFLLIPFIITSICTPANGGDVLTIDDIRTRKQNIIEKTMGLNEEEAKLFWPLYREYQVALEEVNTRAVKLVDEYVKNYDTMLHTQAGTFLKRFIAIEEVRLELKKTHVSNFGKVLPQKVVARYFQLENKIAALINWEMAQEIPIIK